ncbi:conserved hypothetical protein [Shewanella baltica OS195]|uniref:Uncharacterized protein n=2 Tax=Shewanella baltica TaxID=62322 RepID=A9L163_SHEB9|nr:conserved hypothetical protein [Shewanella baltica OS195]
MRLRALLFGACHHRILSLLLNHGRHMTTPSTSPQAEQQTQTHESETSFWWLIILLAIVAVSLLGLYFMNFNGGWGNQGDFGTFGDFLGGVLNPILGFATVGLLIWSLKLQMNELALSRQELALTRQELAETKKETAMSRQAMEQQVTHLKQEAELSELTRLLAKTTESYQITLSARFTIEELQYTKEGEKRSHHNFEMDFRNLLTKFYPSFSSSDQNSMSGQLLSDKEVLQNLNSIRFFTILISDLSLKYLSIKKSTEFARVYLSEAYDFLHTINQIHPNEITLDRAGKISHILINSVEIMPNNLTE